MPVFEQGYRAYTGPVSRTSRAFAIAWENVRPRMRWWGWLLLATLLAWPYLVWGVVVFAAAMIEGQPFGRIPIAPPTVAYESGRFSMGLVLACARGTPPAFFWEVVDHAAYSVVAFAAILGAGLLASDRRTGALQVFFARPVRRRDYLLGKLLALSVFVAMTTAAPCLLLWAESVGFGGVSEVTWRTFVSPVSILAVSAFHALWAAGLVLSLSAVMKRPALVAILAIFLDLAAEAVGQILSEALHDKAWLVVRPSVAIGGTVAPLCGLDRPPWFDPAYGIAIAVALPAALLAFVAWRVRAVEVVT